MKRTISIDGMSCEHCVKAVKNALLEVDGVSEAVVDLELKQATITVADNVSDSTLSSAVTEAGYDVVAMA